MATQTKTIDWGGNTLKVKDLQINVSRPGTTGTSLSATELAYVDGVTAGTVTASKAVVVDSSKDVSGFNSITVTGPVGTGTASAGVLNLNTLETTVIAGDQLGRIDFKAPAETGADAILVAGSIWAEAGNTFDATTNDTDLVFANGLSEAATEKMRLSSDGKLAVTGTGSHIAVRREIIADGAAVVLNENQSGGLVVMDKTDGSLTTLPEITAANIGMTFSFQWPASYASGTQKIITGNAADLIVGTVTKFDTDTLTDPLSVESFNGTNHIAVVIDAVTDGGLLGSWLNFTAISATQWLIQGMLHHSGNVSASASTT